jgi:hypothetical protein
VPRAGALSAPTNLATVVEGRRGHRRIRGREGESRPRAERADPLRRRLLPASALPPASQGRWIEDLHRRIEEVHRQIEELRHRIEGAGEDGELPPPTSIEGASEDG